MADLQNSILLGVKLGDTSKLKSELQSQIEKIDNLKVKISKSDISALKGEIQTQLNAMDFTIKIGKVDTSGIETVINKTKQATQQAEQFKNVMGKSLNIGDGAKAFDDLQKRANEIRNTVDSLAKISFNTTKNGGIKDATITYTDNMGKLVTETMSWKQVLSQAEGVTKNIFTTTNVKVSENVQQLSKMEAKLESIKGKMQGSLNTASAMGINPEVISSLQTKLNSINTRTPVSQINQLQKQINELGGNSSSNINRLQNAINSITNKMNSIKSSKADIINNNDIAELRTAENEVIKLKELLAQVKSGKVIDGKLISSEIATARNSVSQLSTTLNGMKTNLNSMSTTGFFSGISNFLAKTGLFYGTIQVVQEIKQQLREATEYVKTMDTHMSNMQMITGKTREQITQMTSQFKELASQLHETNSNIMSGAEELMRAGYDDSTTKKMLEASTMASKISGQTNEDTTAQLIAIKNAYNMTGDQMQHVIDTMSKLDNSSASSFKDISDAVMRTAFSANQAGTSFDTLSAYITTVSEKTRREASSIGEAFKSIYSRYSNIKLGNIDEDGKSINDVETAMNRIGISIRSSKGEFKDFDVVLQEFVDKYKEGKLSQVDFMSAINTLGGTRKQNASYVQKCA
jgi:TP901 family phage tail tape measure protein